MTPTEIDEKDVERTYVILKKEAESGGYFLNPDAGFTKNLVRGLLKTNSVMGTALVRAVSPRERRKKTLILSVPATIVILT
jgi:ferredoxin-thioredoxin reductase catalytic subunit